jgi:hypothetical protein
MVRTRTALDLFTIWVYDQPDIVAERPLPTRAGDTLMGHVRTSEPKPSGQ